jgi:hypothetical protein
MLLLSQLSDIMLQKTPNFMCCYLQILTITSCGFIYTFCAIIFVLFVFLFTILMMVADIYIYIYIYIYI